MVACYLVQRLFAPCPRGTSRGHYSKSAETKLRSDQPGMVLDAEASQEVFHVLVVLFAQERDALRNPLCEPHRIAVRGFLELREDFLILSPTRNGSLRDPQSRSALTDRKSTRLNSSHANISYAVFCLKKKISKYPY